MRHKYKNPTKKDLNKLEKERINSRGQKKVMLNLLLTE